MNDVLRELHDIVIIKTNPQNVYGINYREQPYRMCILSAGFSIEEIEKLNTTYPIKAINNKILTNNIHLNKFKISLNEYNKKCSNIYYHRYNFFNIHHMYFENGDWYLIVSDCFDINNIKYVINLPHHTKNYFFNRKSLKCTCQGYRKNKKCEHRDIFVSNINDIGYYFVLLLYNKLNIPVCHCLDILRECAFTASILI